MADIAKLEEQIYAKRREVRYDMRDLTVEYISDKYRDGIEYSNADDDERNLIQTKRNVLFIPDYQRDFTWDERRSSKLIESILLGLPIPFIFVAENRDGAWEIVDGSQRIRAIYHFTENKLMLSGLESLSQANGLTFEKLEKGRQGKFLDTALRLIILSEETTDDVKKDMFERINRGSDLLKPMEKRKGIYTGIFTTFIYDYVEKSSTFKDLLLIDKWLENRQERQELLLRFFALSENDAYMQGVPGSLSDFLDRYIERKNNELAKLSPAAAQVEVNSYEEKIESVNKVIKSIFPFGYRHKSNPQTKRSVFEAISIGVWKALQDGKIKESLTPEKIATVLQNDEFKKNTHVPNQLHKKQKLTDRVNYIRSMLSGD
ncbi:hypothetical protein [Pseudomonas sp. 24 E 1]|uniref:DUF262 domain-containing protein n=1 Tax=Pseudomonas sp. 24 E 1 TaxID=1844094 RepID=UPI000811E008|nr:DUF262 domain-containing protein [Pseudomonas sp. 24 E 1]CRM05830.1 hypothetical protein [Pseudomonas sp. 24 E 1]